MICYTFFVAVLSEELNLSLGFFSINVHYFCFLISHFYLKSLVYVFPSVFLVCAVFIKSYQLSLRKQSEVNWLSRVQLFVTLWTDAPHAPLSMGILQARTLEWVAISFSRASS